MREKLKKLRKEKKLTQAEVSALAGITRAFYTNIEKGYRNPSVNTAKKIAGILGFDWKRFYEEEMA